MFKVNLKEKSKRQEDANYPLGPQTQTLKHHLESQKPISLKNKDLDQNPNSLSSQNSQSFQKIFMGGLHPFVTKQDLIKLFSPFIQLINEGKTNLLDSYHPEVTQKTQHIYHKGEKHIFGIELKMDHKTKLNKGYAFFKVKSFSIAQQIVKRNWNLFGRILQCQFKNNEPNNFTSKASCPNKQARLYLSNLKKSVTDEDLVKYFGTYTDFRAAYVIRKVDGGSRCFGFIDFHTQNGANLALKKYYSCPIVLHGSTATLKEFSQDTKVKYNQKVKKNPSIPSSQIPSNVYASQEILLDATANKANPPNNTLNNTSFDFKVKTTQNIIHKVCSLKTLTQVNLNHQRIILINDKKQFNLNFNRISCKILPEYHY